jgi:hypothetical protein
MTALDLFNVGAFLLVLMGAVLFTALVVGLLHD